jgi:hypothetical protein
VIATLAGAIASFLQKRGQQMGRQALTGGALAFSVLRAAAAAGIAVSAAGQQQDYDDDEKECEHGHLPRLG